LPEGGGRTGRRPGEAAAGIALPRDRAGNRPALAERTQTPAGPPPLAPRWVGGRRGSRLVPGLSGHVHARSDGGAQAARRSGARIRALARSAIEESRPQRGVSFGGLVCKLKTRKARHGSEGDFHIGVVVSIHRFSTRDDPRTDGTRGGAIPPAPPPPRSPAGLQAAFRGGRHLGARG